MLLTPPAPVTFQDIGPDDLFGWFDFEATYDRAVITAPPGSLLVEVGVFLGKSLVYLARKAQAADKGLRVIGVDTWLGSPEFDSSVFVNDRPINEMPPGFMLSWCYAELVKRDLHRTATLVVSDSVDAADLFASGQAHMVFLDARHDEAGIDEDIAAWLPKVRTGGMLAGHDYDPVNGFPAVKRVVDRWFGPRVRAEKSSWEITV